MTSRHVQGTCIYCGKTAPVTRDHLPPESLFPKPRPSNLVTVPSCLECNNSASKDDEYFRLTLSIRHNAKRPLAKQVADTALRGLARDEHTLFRNNFFQGVREVDIMTADGKYAGRGGSYSVDHARLGKVATRIIRGLYFHHYGNALPTWCEVDTWCEDGLIGVDDNTIQLLQSYALLLHQSPPLEIGDGVFKYWHRLADGNDHNYCSIWLLEFYESTAFFGITVGDTKGHTR